MPDDTATLARLRQRFDVTLERVLDGATTVAMLDFPDHDNIGDSAIWVGEMQALQRLQVKVAYAASHQDFRDAALSGLHHDVPVLLHGGGNFGDLWMEHQRLREHVVASFPRRRIIQLPQTLYFRSAEKIAANAILLSTHRDLAILVRDHPSMTFARERLEQEPVLCPDAAMAIDLHAVGYSPDKGSARPVVCLLRNDVESNHAAPSRATLGIAPFDWRDAPRTRRRDRERRRRRLYRTLLRNPRIANRLAQRTFDRVAVAELKLGLSMLASGDVVATDRLHAAILASLLGRPRVVVENSYGKLGAVLNTWMPDSPSTIFAPDPVAAVALATRLAHSRI